MSLRDNIQSVLSYQLQRIDKQEALEDFMLALDGRLDWDMIEDKLSDDDSHDFDDDFTDDDDDFDDDFDD